MSDGTRKRGRVIGLAAGVFFLGLLAALWWLNHRRRQLEITYREIPVSRGSIDVTILSTGTVQPENKVEIKPPIPGRVERVLVKEGDRVHKTQVLAWMSSSERAAMLDAASAKGAEELKKWESLYQPTPILAPISGTIIQKNVESGQTFASTDAVFVMSDRLTVGAQVDETDIAQIKNGQKAAIVLDAYPGQKIDGHVEKIAYDAKTVNNVTTYIVDVLPEKAPEYMRSGMTANVTFLVISRQDVPIIPNDAIRVHDERRYVLVKNPSPGEPPVEKPVSVGITDGKRTEVTGGLSDGETVLAAEIKAPSGPKSAGGANPFSPMGARPGGGRAGH